MFDQPPLTSPWSFRRLLRLREFRALYVSFTATVGASTLSGFAVATLVVRQTESPLLTALSLYGSTFATVLGALTLMSVADGHRPWRTLVLLQLLSLLGIATQAAPGVPLLARFALLLLLGFFQSLGTGARLGLVSEVIPASAYALARSLMNITSGGTSIVGLTLAALLLDHTSPRVVFAISAALAGLGLLAVARSVPEHSTRLVRRPGLAQTWTTNIALLRHPGQRALLANLWVPNGLIVGCEALFLTYDPDHAGLLLAAGSAGMLLGDLTLGRLLSPARRARVAFPMRVLLAAPYLLFVAHPTPWPAAAAVLLAGTGFAATLPLQEQLLALTPNAVRGQVQGVESAGRMTWQGLGAGIAGALAEHTTSATAITVMALTSLAITVLTRPAVRRAAPVLTREVLR